ncbi:hypothetical protein [Bradyrhizobium sp. 174]|uniref:hypothetical protein n=1 Tax=Bradyrhizobium sp. 174 TaxID=2782645 RepID=UPI001FF9A94B|nr:hypothetical protein [Bradyrhizobium sp. 174]MCK1570785.1 hypothetical protein [Bradyrhizobium sp. 174]
MSDQLPRWECANQRDADQLIKWTNNRLDRLDAIAEHFIHVGDDDEKLITEEKAIEAADAGDLSLLRKLHPELAKFLHRSTRKPGRPPRPEDADAVREAAIDARVIRHLWQQSFGKLKRPQNDKVTAEQIAADRWGVDQQAVRNRLKKWK